MDGVKIADKILHCHDQVLEYAEEAEVKKLFYTGEGLRWHQLQPLDRVRG